MARPARRHILGEQPATIHFIWRCHNTDFLLQPDAVKQRYLELLKEFKTRYHIKIFGYTIMDSHVHALLWLPKRTLWERFSRAVHSKLANFVNRRLKRRGAVVLDRPRTIVLERDEDVLRVMQYIDMNPVRAGMVRRARSYAWGSYRRLGRAEEDGVLDLCPALEALGKTAGQRVVAYRELFSARVRAEFLKRQPELVSVLYVGRPAWVERRVERLRSLSRRSERPPP